MTGQVDRIVRFRWASVGAISVVFFLCVLLVAVTRGTPAADAALLIIGAVLGGMLVVLAIAQARSAALPAVPPLAPPVGASTWYAVADGSTSVVVYDSLGQEVSRGKMLLPVGAAITSVYLTVFRDTITDMGYTPVGQPVAHHGACGCVEFEVTATRFPMRITDGDGAPVE